MLQDAARKIVLWLVWCVVFLRTPFLFRDRRQLPAWLVLIVFAGSSIIIQNWFANFVNTATGVAKFNLLLQGVWGIVDISATLYFIAYLAGCIKEWRHGVRAWSLWGLLTCGGMVISFFLSSPVDRFSQSPNFGIFTAYALLAAAYMIVSAASASWILVRQLILVRRRILKFAFAMVLVGEMVMVPFMVIRTVGRLARVTPWLNQVAVLLSTARFILLPVGCVLVTLQPWGKATVCRYRRIRLYSTWSLLRNSTLELGLAPPPSWVQDLVARGDSWELLHRRTIEIRDSVMHLFEGWASRELVDDAVAYAESLSGDRDVLTLACWLEVARRTAGRRAGCRHGGVLELVPAVGVDVRAETRNLIRLRRAMGSRAVAEFASKKAYD
jgi:hypothetical protein